MAKVCKFKIIVKGKANACAAFYTSKPSYGATVVEEKGTPGNYYLHFEGSCKWKMDYGAKRWNGSFPVVLPEDIQGAGKLAVRNYSEYSMQDRSRMFQVEVLCNYAVLDNDDGAHFVHYKNGVPIFDRTPEELYISPEIIFGEVWDMTYVEPLEPDRIKAYCEPTIEDAHWFRIKFQNPILSEILDKYYYSETLEDVCDFEIDEQIENYAGVKNIDELTSTLFSVYRQLGFSADGFFEELQQRKQEIIQAFSFIEGKSLESAFFCEEYDEDVLDGYDFELKFGVYAAKYHFGVAW